MSPLPDTSSISIQHVHTPLIDHHRHEEPEEDSSKKWRADAKSLPYSIEPGSKMVEMLDFITLRLVQCVEAKDYDVGLLQWDSMLT